MFVDKGERESVISALSKVANVEEIYEVTGEYDIISMVSGSSIEDIRETIQNGIMKIKGVRSTIINIVLSSVKGQKAR